MYLLHVLIYVSRYLGGRIKNFGTFSDSVAFRKCSIRKLFKASFGRREWNRMEMNEKNHFRIFFYSLVWEF